MILTASGGPFRDAAAGANWQHVTPDEACAHPNWVMGRKISVDSATMMNKALEIIEAHWLFGAPAAQIEVVVHPQSVVHSMVEYVDGSVHRAARQSGHAHADRACAGATRSASTPAWRPLDLARIGTLIFRAARISTRFPALRLAYAALRTAGDAPGDASTRPTKSRWPPFSKDACRSPRSRR